MADTCNDGVSAGDVNTESHLGKDVQSAGELQADEERENGVSKDSLKTAEITECKKGDLPTSVDAGDAVDENVQTGTKRKSEEDDDVDGTDETKKLKKDGVSEEQSVTEPVTETGVDESNGVKQDNTADVASALKETTKLVGEEVTAGVDGVEETS